MPLKPEYSWRQTSDKILLDLFLHRSSTRNLSVDVTSRYLKATYPPYHLEVFLLHSIDVGASVARAAAGRLHILLAKAEPGDWECLQRSVERTAAAAERQAAQQELQTLLLQRHSQAKAAKASGERRSVSHQLRLDEDLRAERQEMRQNLIRDFFSQTDTGKSEGNSPIDTPAPDDGQQHEINSAGDENCRQLSSDLLRSSVECSSNSSAGVANSSAGVAQSSAGVALSPAREAGQSGCRGRRVSEDREYDGDEEDHDTSDDNALPQLVSEVSLRGGPRKARRQRRGVGAAMRSPEDLLPRDISAEQLSDNPVPELPNPQRPTSKKGRSGNNKNDVGVRPTRHVTVSYTARPDRVPARRSRDAHLDSHDAHRDSPDDEVHGADAAQRIIAKANALFTSGEYAECAAEYTSLLETCGDSVRAYSNRAAAHLAAGSPELALQDANKALSLLGPSSDTATRQSRLLCLSRRGAALAARGHLNEALNDYEAALTIQPDHPGLKRDRANILRALETSEGSSVLETEEEETNDFSTAFP
ncbi:uncharacterized protein LOC108672261 [Hyalella azteca]|uniref:Uncharacterized protein LOC108672261 n=1 Tax=Hyalella azteca TaxID=294128 RepID=A0A979FRS2_HYAAZ|nr:uncharacterized protein LOC108672261 [Hyalella azteca]XP_047739840.1 uncharacterized protein LOC108672261 [Hyalella azteca]XP_047739841.1 uncharacterized protein LOC108672261 [Hyalella azteca]